MAHSDLNVRETGATVPASAPGRGAVTNATARVATAGRENPGLDVEGILASVALDDPGLNLLLITFDTGISLVESARERVIYVVSPRPASVGRSATSRADARSLPMPDRAFDIVVAHRLIRPGFDAAPLLSEALRVARRDGAIVLVTDPRDLQSAPMPPAGPAHLAQRALNAAGLPNAHFSQYGEHSVAVLRRGSHTR
jgi:SAM-dependent methyltransferase